MTAPSAEQLVIERREWRQRIVRDYEPVANRLQSAYQRTIRQLERDSRVFVEQLRSLGEDGVLSAEDLRRLNSYQKLLVRIEAEMNDFATIARNEAAGLADDAVTSGLEAAQQMTVASSGRAGSVVAAAWNQVDPEALARLISYVDSAALRGRFASFGENAANNIADVLLSLVAQGKNPVMIARVLNGWYSVPFSWSSNMVRTAQIYSYRGATHAAYAANSDIINGWMWQSALDERVCISCLSQHGTVFPVDQTLNDHHQGRCVPVPVVRGTRWAQDVKTGPQWFDEQPVETQTLVMGQHMHEAYRRGEVWWSDFSTPYQDEVYGTMLRAASLREILERR